MPTPACERDPFEPLDLERLVTFRLSRLSEALARGAVKRYLIRLGLNITEWRVIALLARYAPLTASELSQRAGLDKGWISRSVSNLIQRGHIVRSVDAQDGRQQLLALSPTGLATYRQAASCAHERHERLLSVLSSEQRTQLMQTLDLLQQRADAMLDEFDDETSVASKDAGKPIARPASTRRVPRTIDAGIRPNKD